MKRILLVMIHFYRACISPMKPACCRFYPTCSTYALQAVTKFGALKGGLLAFKRILKCHPYYHGTFYDPVPDVFVWRQTRKKDISEKEKRKRFLFFGQKVTEEDTENSYNERDKQP